MNGVIKKLPFVSDADLALCLGHGVAYQLDMSLKTVEYDEGYLAKCKAYEGSDIARAVVSGRLGFLSRHVGAGASVLDVGVGSGEFLHAAISHGYAAKGYDVISSVAERLWFAGIYGCSSEGFDAVTMWDSIEHMEDAEPWLVKIKNGAVLFVSLPIFTDLKRIRESKHYRPGEHLYYWTAQGFIEWVEQFGFRLIERSNHESESGRESIGAFAFRRVRGDN